MRRSVIVLLVSLTLGSAFAEARQPAAKPIVYVLSTGGTIAGSGSSSTDLSNYKAGFDPRRAARQGRAADRA